VYLDTVKQQLQQLGLVQPDELVGCTASEISNETFRLDTNGENLDRLL